MILYFTILIVKYIVRILEIVRKKELSILYICYELLSINTISITF